MKYINIESPKHGTHQVMVSDEDYEMLINLGPWHLSRGTKTFYAVRHERVSAEKYCKYRTDKMEWFVLGAKRIDHFDGNGLNNTRENLRPATQAENLQNLALRSDDKSGFRGVSWSNAAKKWVARVRLTTIGLFDTPELAGAAASRARKLLMPFSNESRYSHSTEER